MRGSLTDKAPRFGRGLLGVRFPPPQPLPDGVVGHSMQSSGTSVPEFPHLLPKSGNRRSLSSSKLHGAGQAAMFAFRFDRLSTFAADPYFVFAARKGRGLAIAVGAQKAEITKTVIVIHTVGVVQNKGEGLPLPRGRRVTGLTLQLEKPLFDETPFEVVPTVGRVLGQHFLEWDPFVAPLLTRLFVKVVVGNVFFLESPTKSGNVVSIEEPKVAKDICIRSRPVYQVGQLIPGHAPDRTSLFPFLHHTEMVTEPPLYSNGGSTL